MAGSMRTFVTDRRTDGLTDGRSWFYRTRRWLGGSKKIKNLINGGELSDLYEYFQYFAKGSSLEAQSPLKEIRFLTFLWYFSTIGHFDFKLIFKTAIFAKNWLKWLKIRKNPVTFKRFLIRCSEAPRLNQNPHIFIVFCIIEHFKLQNFKFIPKNSHISQFSATNGWKWGKI